MFNDDFQDFQRALWQHQVRYILVGGYSVILHGYSRTTGYLDVWVERSADNYRQLIQAFMAFEMPTFDMSAHKPLENPAIDVFTFGRQPVAIDNITQLKGLDIAEAFAATIIEVENLPVRLIQYQHLLAAKKAAGHPRDKNDIDNLIRHKKSGT